MMKRLWYCCVLLLLFSISSLFSTETVSYARLETKGVSQETVQLNIMTFNIFSGGALAPLQKTADSIKRARADIVGIQESGESLAELADLLGYDYNERLNILSRYPIIDYHDEDFVYIEVKPRKVVAVSNVHLPAAPYLPYLLRDEQYNVSKVVQHENTIGRMRDMASRFRSLPRVAAYHIPVFLTGDFNTPSHLDWTAENKSVNFGYVVEWPVSKRLEQLGFRDSFREVYRNSNSKPSYTWDTGLVNTGADLSQSEKHDRIDFIYYSSVSVIKVLDSKVFGEPSPYSDIIVNDWTSDHRAVVSTFEVVPGPSVNFPDLSLDKTTYRKGENITVSFKGATRAADWIGIFPIDSKAEEGSVLWKYAGSGSEVIGPLREAGTVSFSDTALLTSGTYKVLFFSGNGYLVVDEAQFELTKSFLQTPVQEEVPTITLEKQVYHAGEKIKAKFTGSTSAMDWIGILKVDAQPTEGSLMWKYVNSHALRTSGTISFADTLALAPGTYDAVYFANESYQELSRTTFQVVVAQ